MNKPQYLNYQDLLTDLVGVLMISDQAGTVTSTMVEMGTIDAFKDIMGAAQNMLRRDGHLQEMENHWNVFADPLLTEAELKDRGFRFFCDSSMNWQWWHKDSDRYSTDAYPNHRAAMRGAERAIPI